MRRTSVSCVLEVCIVSHPFGRATGWELDAQQQYVAVDYVLQ